MSRFSFESVLDQNLKVTSNNFVVALLGKPNEDQVFLMMEGVNHDGKIILNRYDFSRDMENKDQYYITINSEVFDAKDAKESYDYMINNEVVTGKRWLVSKEKANRMHDYIEQHKKGAFNELGSYATGPQIVKMGKVAFPLVKDSAQIAAVGATGVVLGPEAAATAVGGITTTKAVPSSLYEPFAQKFFGFFGKKLGKTGTVVENSMKQEGENSFTWAQKLLLSMDDPTIVKDIPVRPREFLVAEGKRNLVHRS